MPRKRSKNNINHNQNDPLNLREEAPDKKDVKSFIERHKDLFEVTIPVILFLFTVFGPIREIDNSLAEIKSDISSLKTDIDNIKENVSRIEDNYVRHEERINEQEIKLAELQGRLIEISAGQPVYIKPTSAFTDVISIKKDMIQFLSAPQWKNNTMIGRDLYSGKEYYPDDLKNKTVVLSYKEDDQEVFFMGQFNERNHWDGECLINVYSNECFTISTKAVYTDGERIDYKQLFPAGDVLCYADRHNFDNGSSGDTWKYENFSPIIQNISFNEPQADMMIEPESYIKSISNNCISHYHGNTENGNYEDDTGNAFFIAFFEDGSTRTVYKGKFKDGIFNDETGEAWYITMEKGDKPTSYMYFKGGFDLGKPDQNRRKEFTNPLTREQADTIIANQPFENEVIWNEAGFE